MKPTKNRVFCIGCRKHKMLFDSEAKAENFLKFNADDILEETGKAPVRSYYCTLCNGWHVTSNASLEAGEARDVRDNRLKSELLSYKESKEGLAELRDLANGKLSEAKEFLRRGDYISAEQMLEVCSLHVDDMRANFRQHLSIATMMTTKINKVYELMNSLKEYESMTEEQKMAVHENAELLCVDKKLFGYVNSINVWRFVEENVDEIERLHNLGEIAERDELIATCMEKTELIKGSAYKNVVEAITKRLNSIKRSRPVKPVSEHKVEHEKVEPQKPPRRNYQDGKAYKTKVLEVIAKLEDIQRLFDEGDFDGCDDAIEVCEFLIDDIGKEDDNTKLLKAQLEQWRNKGSLAKSCVKGIPVIEDGSVGSPKVKRIKKP